MNKSSYGRVTKVLHWLSVLIILYAAVSGFAVSTMAVPDSLKDWIPVFNVILTSLFIPIFLFRIIWNFLLARNDYKANWVGSKVVRFVHTFLYIVTFIVVISGVFMLERPVFLADLKIVPNLESNSYFRQLFTVIHHIANMVLVALVLLHVSAVVKHQINNNSILNKML